MKCPECQQENPDDAIFCNKCAHELTSSSEVHSQAFSIEEKIDKIQRYLPEGLTEKILAQRGKIEGERKQVTVMFCDMEGFTPMVERLGSEKAYSVMDEVYEILIHKVHDYEGTVNEMTGDGIMALFGAPIALEDAPQRALRSALAVHNEIAKLNRQGQWIVPIRMRIGVHTGPVVVGTLGNNLRVEFKAVGDTVNLASRMEGLAEPGTTYVTQDSFKLTEGLFHFEFLGEKVVKGKESAIPVYKLLSAIKDVHRPRLGVERSIYSEMVGRAEELNKLEFQVMKAIQGEGSIVNIIGEAGIGKSRLIAELKNRDVMKQVALFEGRAISTGRNLSFHPIIDLLKQWARIGADDIGAVALSRLETAIRRVVPEDPDEVLPFVATLMGLKLSGRYVERVKGIEGEALEKLILKNIRDLIIKGTELKPHVIVMEDLHWSDTSSIELTGALFRLAETQRIAFINVFRPGYKETGDKIIENLKEKLSDYYLEINLQPLNKSMSKTLINNMLNIKGIKHSIINQIIERSGGNPFFIEEVVRSLIDEGAIVVRDGVFEVTKKMETMVIPLTINEVLMARIDKLEEKTRHLVKIASIIGRSFFYRILTEMARTIEDIDNRLSYLKEIQLILERKRLDEIEYLFKHALTQEAAYESILLQKRKELHLNVAETIEKVFKERLHEFYGMLAFHCSRGENLEKTEEYLIKAGEEALRSSASSEALSYYQEGLNLYMNKYADAADPEKLALFEKNIALAFFNKGQYENALEHFDKVLELWKAGSPKRKTVVLLKFIYELLIVIINLYFPSKKDKKSPNSRDNEILDIKYKISVSLVTLDPKRCFIELIGTLKRMTQFDQSKISNSVGIWLSASGLFTWSGISFRLSKKILKYNKNRINRKDVKQMLYYDLFVLLYDSFIGNWKEIREYDETLVLHNLKIGEFWNVSTYLVTHCFVKISQGAFREAEMIIHKLSEIYETYENEDALGYKYASKRRLLTTNRKLHDALKESEAENTFNSDAGRDMDMTQSLGYLAVIQLHLKDIDGAEESLSQLEKVVSKKGPFPPNYLSGYLMAKFLFDLYSLEQSLYFNEKLKISEYWKKTYQSGKQAINNSMKYAFNRTEVLRLMGLYFWLIGKQNKAVTYWRNSIKVAKGFDARVDLARTYMEIGRRFSEEQSKFKELNGISAKEYLEMARNMFIDMDLQWDLDELDKIAIDF